MSLSRIAPVLTETTTVCLHVCACVRVCLCLFAFMCLYAHAHVTLLCTYAPVDRSQNTNTTPRPALRATWHLPPPVTHTTMRARTLYNVNRSKHSIPCPVFVQIGVSVIALCWFDEDVLLVCSVCSVSPHTHTRLFHARWVHSGMTLYAFVCRPTTRACVRTHCCYSNNAVMYSPTFRFQL